MVKHWATMSDLLFISDESAMRTTINLCHLGNVVVWMNALQELS